MVHSERGSMKNVTLGKKKKDALVCIMFYQCTNANERCSSRVYIIYMM